MPVGALVVDLHAIQPQLRLPVSGLRENTSGSVMKRPPSCGQQCRIGKSISEKSSLRMTSLHGPLGHDLGKERAHLGQLRQHLQLADQALRASASPGTRRCARATSSTESTSSAISIRRMTGEGVDQHRDVRSLSASRTAARGRRVFTARSANSVISRMRVDFERNALQLALLFERADELAQIVICHVSVTTLDVTMMNLSGTLKTSCQHAQHSSPARAAASDGLARSLWLRPDAWCSRRATWPSWKRPRRRSERPAARRSSSAIDLGIARFDQRAFSQGAKESGRIDILVNNAGITRDGLALRMKRDDWDAVHPDQSHRLVPLHPAGAARHDAERWGRIINISSVVGESGNAGQANYVASKAGLIGLTKSLAQEMAQPQHHGERRAPGIHRYRHDRTCSPTR